MQIRVLFFSCLLALALMATCLGGWILTWAEANYQLAGRLEQAVDVSASLFAVADAMVTERPAAGDALLLENSADPASRASIAASRQASDRAIVTAAARIHQASYPEAPRQLEILHTIQGALIGSRARVDTALTLPKSQRNPAFFGDFIDGMNVISSALKIAMNICDIADLQHDGVTMDLLSLNRQLWSIRALASRRVGILMAAIDRHIPIPPEQLKQQPWLEGRMSEDWVAVDDLWAQLASMPDVADPLVAPLAAARAAFDAQDNAQEALLALAQDDRPYSVPAYDIGQLAVRTGSALTAVRDVALTVVRTRVHRNQEAAALQVALAAGVLLAITALTVVVLFILRLRVVAPVLALTKAIHRLALRDYAAEIPVTTRDDEIGRMAAALETLRQGAIAAAQAETKIAHMARHDPLTGLANRTLLHERMEHAVSMSGRGEKCAALCVDLDRFKDVNEMYGNPVGDMLLRAVADKLSACVRETDIVSRVGGDEFVVLLVDLESPDAAGLLARRIVRTLSQPHELDGQTITISVSVGVAIAPQDAGTASALMRCAGTALDRAKQDEPGSFRFFEPEMDARLQIRRTLERDLREAVSKNSFEVMYQPQYNLTDDRLCGFEALARWRHPTLGMIEPSVFIPIAEETGLIVPIGAWVLRQACAEAMHWPATVKIAVNLSAVQFKNHALAQTVRQALADAGLPASRLDLEITESLLLTDSAAILATLHELHDIGASISMDDFGTGYSSLSYLRSFPFDKIKIDQSFIRDLSERADSQAIVRAVVALGNSLGMTTTAEGVETADQLARLRHAGCNEVQGYLFSKPVSADAARQLGKSRQETAKAVA